MTATPSTEETLEAMKAYFADYGFTNFCYTTPNKDCVYSDLNGAYVHLYPSESKVELTTIDGIIKSTTDQLSFPNRNIPTFLRHLNRHRPADEASQHLRESKPLENGDLRQTQARLNSLVSTIVKSAADAGLIEQGKTSVTGAELSTIISTLSERAKQPPEVETDEPLQLANDADSDEQPSPSR
ncbi:hypothetical protein [Marinobacter sp. tcs-11]|uniref:hypothetical protein n=1 Tax=Marinobacter sp. tcs-11 TaxID=1742860 RepID=UPI00257B47F4|nr:hypothetical protein [Marinobacter sp. tcs-11]